MKYIRNKAQTSTGLVGKILSSKDRQSLRGIFTTGTFDSQLADSLKLLTDAR